MKFCQWARRLREKSVDEWIGNDQLTKMAVTFVVIDWVREAWQKSSKETKKMSKFRVIKHNSLVRYYDFCLRRVWKIVKDPLSIKTEWIATDIPKCIFRNRGKICLEEHLKGQYWEKAGVGEEGGENRLTREEKMTL